MFPREISAQPGNEKHAVRCCDNKAKTCVSPEPCFLESTYQEASEICLERGLELCRYTEELSEICCQTGCDIDPITMWISDEGLGKYKICNAQYKMCLKCFLDIPKRNYLFII